MSKKVYDRCLDPTLLWPPWPLYRIVGLASSPCLEKVCQPAQFVAVDDCTRLVTNSTLSPKTRVAFFSTSAYSAAWGGEWTVDSWLMVVLR